MKKGLIFLFFGLSLFIQAHAGGEEKAKRMFRKSFERREKQRRQVSRGDHFAGQREEESETKGGWKLWQKVATGVFSLGLIALSAWSIYHVFSDKERFETFLASFSISFLVSFFLSMVGIR